MTGRITITLLRIAFASPAVLLNPVGFAQSGGSYEIVAGSLQQRSTLSGGSYGMSGLLRLSHSSSGGSYSLTLEPGLQPPSVEQPPDEPEPCVNITGFRPQTEHFPRQAVPDNLEAADGVGIRPSEWEIEWTFDNYLIEVTLEADVVDGTELVLRRSNSAIHIWDSEARELALLGNNDETIIDLQNGSRTVWAEHPESGTWGQPIEGWTLLELELRQTDDHTVICTDELRFFPFQSVVIVFGGNTQFPSNPPSSNHGTFQLALEIYELGYDVHMFNEEEISDGLDSLPGVVTTRSAFAGRVAAIIGYSQGGGATYKLADVTLANCAFTAYIDAVIHDSDSPEHRRPPGSAFHVNFYLGQSGPDRCWVSWATRYEIPNGVATTTPGANYQVDVDQTGWGADLCHTTIDNAPNVHTGVLTYLLPVVSR